MATTRLVFAFAKVFVMTLAERLKGVDKIYLEPAAAGS
jgi:hypothetical protein